MKSTKKSFQFEISLKTTLVCSAIILVLLLGGGLISMSFQSSMSDGMIKQYSDIQGKDLIEYEKKQVLMMPPSFFGKKVIMAHR